MSIVTGLKQKDLAGSAPRNLAVAVAAAATCRGCAALAQNIGSGGVHTPELYGPVSRFDAADLLRLLQRRL
jgi:hypothetical protein